MLDAETRTMPPLVGERGIGCTAAPGAPSPTSMAGWGRYRTCMSGRRVHQCPGAWQCSRARRWVRSSDAIHLIQWHAGRRSRRWFSVFCPMSSSTGSGENLLRRYNPVGVYLALAASASKRPIRCSAEGWSQLPRPSADRAAVSPIRTGSGVRTLAWSSREQVLRLA